MPKISVYLPDGLYRRARDRGLKVSALTQEAIRRELDARPNEGWVRSVEERPSRCEQVLDTTDLVGAVRDDFGS